jgi:hypothetical protein
MGNLPDAPTIATWGYQAESKFPQGQNWGMMLNDSEGDCVWAAGGHSIENWTANASGLFVPPDAAIQTGYESTGFIPGNPSTDNGTAITQMLQYWRDTGIAGHQIVGWAEFDPTNKAEWQFVIANFGLAFLGCLIRQSDMNSFDNGSIWTPGTDSVLGGHGVIATDYDGDTVSIITWAKRIQAVWDWMTQECDEAYAIVTQSWIESNGESPSGLNMQEMESDLGCVKQ